MWLAYAETIAISLPPSVLQEQKIAALERMVQGKELSCALMKEQCRCVCVCVCVHACMRACVTASR